MKQANGGQSDWSYAPQVMGVANTIENTVNIKIGDKVHGFASYLTLQNRLYYDAKFRASAVLGSEGTFGMIFRFIDQFNFYAFRIIKKGGEGKIQILKMQ
jgi:hypothetical protein